MDETKRQKLIQLRRQAASKGGKAGIGASKRRVTSGANAILCRWRKGVKWCVPKSIDRFSGEMLRLSGVPFWHTHMNTPKPKWAGRNRLMKTLPVKYRYLLK